MLQPAFDAFGDGTPYPMSTSRCTVEFNPELGLWQYRIAPGPFPTQMKKDGMPLWVPGV